MTERIPLNSILQLSSKDLDRTKIRFSIKSGETSAINEYLRDPEIVNNQWLFWRSKNSLFREGDVVVSMVKLPGDRWLLATVKTVDRETGVLDGIGYEGSVVEALSPWFGRLIVSFKKSFQNPLRKAKGLIDDMSVDQVLPEPYGGEGFLGYDNVCLSFMDLATIVTRNKSDWIAALENQKAVYLISDLKTGKLYVGSATSENGMLLNRWRSYVNNGHGGNKLLMNLVEKSGFNYVKENFQFTILENYNARVDNLLVLKRESWWKRALGSRAYGLNGN